MNLNVAPIRYINQSKSPSDGQINNISVPYQIYDTVEWAVELYGSDLFNLNLDEYTKEVVSTFKTIYSQFDFTYNRNIEVNFLHYCGIGFENNEVEIDEDMQDIFKTSFPLNRPKIDLEIFQATDYYKKYEPLIDIITSEGNERNIVTFYVNNRDVDWSIKFIDWYDGFALTGVYFDDELVDGEEFVDYGMYKTLDEVCEFLLQDHIDMEINICLEELLDENLSAYDVISWGVSVHNENVFHLDETNFVQKLMHVVEELSEEMSFKEIKFNLNKYFETGQAQNSCQELFMNTLPLKTLKQPPLLSAEDHFSTQPNNVEPSSIEM